MELYKKSRNNKLYLSCTLTNEYKKVHCSLFRSHLLVDYKPAYCHANRLSALAWLPINLNACTLCQNRFDFDIRANQFGPLIYSSESKVMLIQQRI